MKFKIDKKYFENNLSEVADMFNNTGIIVVEKYFDKEDLREISKELSLFWNKIPDNSFVSFGEKSSGITFRNKYKSGKGLSIGRGYYSSFPRTISLVAENVVLGDFLNTCCPRMRDKMKQVFCTYDYNKTTEKNMSVNSWLHIDSNPAIKFGVMLCDTKKDNGSLRIIPGSHIEGSHMRREMAKTIIQTDPDFNWRMIDFQKYLNIKSEAKEAISIETSLSDLVIFNTECWHSGGWIRQDKCERMSLYYHNRL